ncbi:NADP-dependent malic enzyme [Candidatus Curtissbacteria bacterium]|nr:NADP-dependent malic enzyme [Candidatus Curtissbacteria bacterium]
MTKTDSISYHKEFGGKLAVVSKVEIENREDLSLAYTPGVSEVSKYVAEDVTRAWEVTGKGNAVAVVTDGSAVLGLGNIGAEAALPVMEGKAVLFKELGGVDAYPILIKTQDNQTIIDLVKNIAPGFGGINLEDIAAPNCFVIEEALQGIGIPVFHDDQWGTAIVVLAALQNALEVVDKNFTKVKVVVSGAGAAGMSISKLLLRRGVGDLILVDSKGIIYDGREGMNEYKREIADISNFNKLTGAIEDALVGADVFIGVSKGGIVNKTMIEKMSSKAIVFAMANPDPEIMPEEARLGGAFIVGTGRSDFDNQINNLLAFPGIFKGALSVRATSITMEMKLAAVEAIAASVTKPTVNKIVPDPLDKSVTDRVAVAVADAWREKIESDKKG